jgi:putative glycosyltransferase (TIGR04348 family)
LSIRIVSTTPRFSRKGNRVTAVRWSRILKSLGHRVQIEEQYQGGACDLLVALHARHSFPSVELFAKAYPERPIVLALTGTDLYQDIHFDATAQRALLLASRLIVLQPLGIREVPRKLRDKVRVIFQSAEAPKLRRQPREDVFAVCVLAHLRAVKDPFRAAEAARLLPRESRIQVLQVGAALDPGMEERAREEAKTNLRYRALGGLPRWKALRLLSRSQLLVLSSLAEGGANAVTEAIACGVPILASRIPGSVGLLGLDYPGYFQPGDTLALSGLLRRAEEDSPFLAKLKAHCQRLAPMVQPKREREAWSKLLKELPGLKQASRSARAEAAELAASGAR